MMIQHDFRNTLTCGIFTQCSSVFQYIISQITKICKTSFVHLSHIMTFLCLHIYGGLFIFHMSKNTKNCVKIGTWNPSCVHLIQETITVIDVFKRRNICQGSLQMEGFYFGEPRVCLSLKKLQETNLFDHFSKLMSHPCE